jgi:protein-S-isoprenylcysteine O-methyltransferase Ste14
MENNLFFILVIICFFSHIVRFVYEILKHKKKITPNKLSFVIVFTDMFLLWTSWFYLCSKDPFKINLPEIARYLGLLFAGFGLVIFLIALFTIKTLESYDGELITKGVYSKIRHPMYFSFILWCLGFPIFCDALFSLILSFLFIANILFWRYLEEKELEERFVSYKEYKKKTIF